MKVRALPVMLSLIVTLGLLFGGWFTYQQFYVQDPIEALIVAKPQVILNDLQIFKDQVTVDLDFKDPNTFAMDYKEVKQLVENKTGKKVVIQLPVIGNEMKSLWEEEYFAMAEAINKKEYTKIPNIIENIKTERKLEQAVTRMDEENIYVYLKKGSDHLYAVLPVTEEVKSNE